MFGEVIDVPQPVVCENCTPCLRLRLMDFGFVPGQKMEIKEKKHGLWIINMLSENGNIEQTIGLRPEELERICIKEIL